MLDTTLARQAAREIATDVLGHDPGPPATAPSLSHQVHLAGGVVVKVIAAGAHSRLAREIALSPHLPAGLTAPLLGSGAHVVEGTEVRYACYTRVPGAAPGMGLPDAGEAAACSLAEQAVQRLHTLHTWTPTGGTRTLLREDLDHGGFTTRATLLGEIDAVATADRTGAVPAALLDGLTAIAEQAPGHVPADVPVHADCHWGNWLAEGGTITALLDFEWARLGTPMDDWFFLIADSGAHTAAVLKLIAARTAIPEETLRAECELREANYLIADLRLALTEPRQHAHLLPQRLTGLHMLVKERAWWR